jgi:4-oxalocrotonate tautomerase family enzyme
MPVVEVKTWAGKSPEVKARIIEGITKVFEGLGIPATAVTVVILDVPKDSWGMDGKPVSQTHPYP